MSNKHVLAVICLLIVAWFFFSESSIKAPNGILAPNAPIQTTTVAGPFSYKTFILSPLANFDISARVLGKEHYHFDSESALSPIDLALGWQSMSDSKILSGIDISQGGRFYNWYTKSFAIPRESIESQSANMHMVPSTAEIKKQLDNIPVNAGIRIQGFLIEARNDKGWVWTSSTTRYDTGYGACELIWVTKVERLW